MLKHLYIENYALIEKLDIDFSEGFSVITGETGAGKSILLGALSLILGQRADTQVLLDSNKKCIVEGSFLIKDLGLNEIFKQNELDFEEVAILRREINQQGKSRAFINDTPVNLAVMKIITERLIDIHSQHQTLTLAERGFQISIVDGYANHIAMVKEYKSVYLKYKELINELHHLNEEETKSKADLDYFQFQFEELESAKLIEDEQEIAESELETLNHTEDIKQNLNKVLFLLKENENNILTNMVEINKTLTQIARFKTDIQTISERTNSSYLELKDIANELTIIEQGIVYDPEHLAYLKNRLDIIYHLQQKHRTTTIKELIEIKNTLQIKIENINSFDNKIIDLKKEIASLEASLKEKAAFISGKRKNVVSEIEKQILESLSKLGMPHASFFVQINPLPELTSTGIDEISFLFNANLGGEPKEIGKIASGGELSRLMLAIKSLISQKNFLPTILFDEIDIGVSGDVASKVGSIMKKMAETMQVITITHLPQIAAKGSDHFFVYKEFDNTSTKSNIRKLSNEERIVEIAKMLSGNSPTLAATENARELLQN